MVKKTIAQKEAINNLEKFYNSRQKVIIFFREYAEMLYDANFDSKHNYKLRETKWKLVKLREKDLKY